MGRYLVLCALQYSATPDPKGPPTLYQPGEIVNLTAAAAAPLLASGVVMLDPADTVASFTAATAVHLATSDAADLAGVVAASLGSVAVVPADYATQSTRATLAAKKITGTGAGVATHVIGVDATDRRWVIALTTPVTVAVGGVVSLSAIDYEAL